MASLLRLCAVQTLAGRRIPVVIRPTARRFSIPSRSALTHPPRSSPWKSPLFSVLGSGVGAGTCFVWWKRASDLTPVTPLFEPERELDIFFNLVLQLPLVCRVLDGIGSSSKLKPVFDTRGEFSVGTLVKTANNTPDIGGVILRIEDTEIKPGKPNIVGFVVIAEPHPNPDTAKFLETLLPFVEERDIRGELARPGMAFIVVECKGAVSSGAYARRVDETGGGNSGSSANSAVMGINE